MKLHSTLKEAKLVFRINQFAVLVVCEGKETVAHVATSDRPKKLLSPRNRMLLALAAAGVQRKAAYDLALLEVDGLDSFLPVDFAGKRRMLIKGR